MVSLSGGWGAGSATTCPVSPNPCSPLELRHLPDPRSWLLLAPHHCPVPTGQLFSVCHRKGPMSLPCSWTPSGQLRPYSLSFCDLRLVFASLWGVARQLAETGGGDLTLRPRPPCTKGPWLGLEDTTLFFSLHQTLPSLTSLAAGHSWEALSPRACLPSGSGLFSGSSWEPPPL